MKTVLLSKIDFLPILSITILSLFMIITPLPYAFAGVECGPDDPDCDGWFDPGDNCPNDYNPGQEDVNDDGIGDACIPPSQLVDDVIEVVEDTLEDVSELTPAQIDALVGKLESAADKLDSEKINGAIGSLNAFINQIQAFMNSGDIPDEEGQALIYAVQSIIDAIE
jgi:hypothetical protein